jgi:hypothetical protein
LNLKLNWFGLAGGFLSLAVVAISFRYPWWQLIIGENIVTVNVSPVTTGVNVFGTMLTVPLLFAINLTGLLTLTTAGFAMVIYSVIPTRSYSKHILGFGYRKPLYSVIFFVVSLVVLTVMVKNFASLSVPLYGAGTITLPQNMIEGATITAQANAGFLWPFWTEIVAAALCIGARFYHTKIITKAITTSSNAPRA